MTESMVAWATIGSLLVLAHVCGIAFFKEKISFFAGDEGWVTIPLAYCVLVLAVFYITIFSIHFFGHRSLFTHLIYPALLYGLVLLSPLFVLRYARTHFFYFLALTALILFVFFSFAFNGDAIQLAEGRFLNGWLASDNTLPWIFAKGIYTLKGTELPVPLFADWMPGDRPPAYTAMLMVPLAIFGGQNPIGPNFEYLVPVYTAASIIINSLYLVPTYLLLREKFDGSAASSLTLTLMLLPVLMINHVFAWPKHFAMFCILSALYLLQKRRIFWTSVAATLAFLAHGNSAYILLPLGVLLLVRYRLKCVPGVLAALTLWAPWLLAQKLIFPPGDRLIKYHLAGVNDITTDSALVTIAKAYEKISLLEWVSFKANNISALFGIAFGDLAKPLEGKPLGWSQFFFPVPALMPVLLGVGISIAAYLGLRRYTNTIATEKPWLVDQYGRYPPALIRDTNVLLIFGVFAAVLFQFGGNPHSLSTNVTLNTSILVFVFIIASQYIKTKLGVCLTCLTLVVSSVFSLHYLGAPDKEFMFVWNSLWLLCLAASLLFIGLARKRFKLVGSI